VQKLVELFLGLLESRLESAALGLRHAFEDRRFDRLSVTHRRDGKPHRSLDEPDAPFRRAPGHVGQRGASPFGQLLVDLLVTQPVLLGFQGRRHRGPEIVNQLGHVVEERHTSPGRQRNRMRPVRLLEVVDVAPVAGGRL
jgi:hypothetical protein